MAAADQAKQMTDSAIDSHALTRRSAARPHVWHHNAPGSSDHRKLWAATADLLYTTKRSQPSTTSY